MKYTVDRFEGDYAVLLGDGTERFDIERSRLPDGLREGDVVNALPDARGLSDITLDAGETELRAQRIRALFDKVKNNKGRDNNEN